MGVSRIMELVSQAEREGITLAAMMSREMSPEEMARLQDELASHMSDNYAKIQHFMAGVEIPSMEEALMRQDELQMGVDLSCLGELSDEQTEEDSS